MRWRKKDAIQRAQSNEVLQEVLRIEPRLVAVIDEAKRQRSVRGYDSVGKYIELKNRALRLAGCLAEKEELRTNKAYDAVMRTVYDLLPPDPE